MGLLYILNHHVYFYTFKVSYFIEHKIIMMENKDSISYHHVAPRHMLDWYSFGFNCVRVFGLKGSWWSCWLKLHFKKKSLNLDLGLLVMETTEPEPATFSNQATSNRGSGTPTQTRNLWPITYPACKVRWERYRTCRSGQPNTGLIGGPCHKRKQTQRPTVKH